MMRRITIDMAPLVASPTPTGKRVEATLMWEASNGDLYVAPDHGSPLYINRRWVIVNAPNCVTSERKES